MEQEKEDLELRLFVLNEEIITKKAERVALAELAERAQLNADRGKFFEFTG